MGMRVFCVGRCDAGMRGNIGWVFMGRFFEGLFSGNLRTVSGFYEAVFANVVCTVCLLEMR